MHIPDEHLKVNYDAAICSLTGNEAWGPREEAQWENLIPPERLKSLIPELLKVRSRVAAERGREEVPVELRPLDSGFIDLPDKLLATAQNGSSDSELVRIEQVAARLRENADRVIVLGIGGSYLGARALFEGLCSTYHNELPPDVRMGRPRVYFEGNNLDNDALQNLIDLIQQTCVEPNIRDERWATIVISKSGKTLETAVAYRILRREAREYYGRDSDWFHKLIVPVTGRKDSFLRDLALADGFSEEDLFEVPDDVGGRYSVFTPVGLLPAAAMGIDIRALLLGASAMTRRFLEEPFETNPVLQYSAISYLMNQEMQKPIRVLSIWSKKLEALGLWYDQLSAESLGKQGLGSTPITAIQTRDLHSRGQQHQEGDRDKIITNLIVRSPNAAPISVGMADRNEDGLNALSRKTYPELLDAASRGTNEAYAAAARPTMDIEIPNISEHSLGQLMQMFMLATVVEGRLMGINPYGQPGVEAYKRNMQRILKEQIKQGIGSGD